MGAIIIVLNAPETSALTDLNEFYAYAITPGIFYLVMSGNNSIGFLVYSLLCLFAVLYLIYYLAPRYGKRHPIVYISVCSIVGSYLVMAIQGIYICYDTVLIDQ